MTISLKFIGRPELNRARLKLPLLLFIFWLHFCCRTHAQKSKALYTLLTGSWELLRYGQKLEEKEGNICARHFAGKRAISFTFNRVGSMARTLKKQEEEEREEKKQRWIKWSPWFDWGTRITTKLHAIPWQSCNRIWFINRILIAGGIELNQHKGAKKPTTTMNHLSVELSRHFALTNFIYSR